MISSELVFVQLAQQSSYVCIVELAMMLETSVSEVRHSLKELGDRVEGNDNDEWRVIKNIIPERILSESEKAERDDLELTLQQAFFVAGQALRSLRDKRLYRETHTTFESYVRDRFDFTRRAADYLISAAEIVENLKSTNSLLPSDDPNLLSKREQFVLKTNVLPTKESQCRSLSKFSRSKNYFQSGDR
jgi:hypothetical protein